MSDIFAHNDLGTPKALILYHQEEENLLENFLNHVGFLQIDGFVEFSPWEVSANQFDDISLFVNGGRLVGASLIIILCTQNLMSLRNFENIARRIMGSQNSGGRAVIPIIASTLMEKTYLDYERIFSPIGPNKLPSDGRAAFYLRTPEEMDAIVAEIVEKIVEVLDVTFYQAQKILIKGRDKIFIAYSRKDFQIAQQIKTFLITERISSWMDKYSLIGGQNWMSRVDQALRESWAMILVMSENSKMSEYVNYEWSFAFGAKCCVIPILFDPVTPHPRLFPIHSLSWYYHPRDQIPWHELQIALKNSRQAFKSGKCNQ